MACGLPDPSQGPHPTTSALEGHPSEGRVYSGWAGLGRTLDRSAPGPAWSPGAAIPGGDEAEPGKGKVSDSAKIPRHVLSLAGRMQEASGPSEMRASMFYIENTGEHFPSEFSLKETEPKEAWKGMYLSYNLVLGYGSLCWALTSYSKSLLMELQSPRDGTAKAGWPWSQLLHLLLPSPPWQLWVEVEPPSQAPSSRPLCLYEGEGRLRARVPQPGLLALPTAPCA